MNRGVYSGSKVVSMVIVIIAYSTIIFIKTHRKMVKVLQYLKYLILKKCYNALQYLC